MNQEQATLLLIKGMISEAPEADQKLVFECRDKLKAIVDEYEGNGRVGFALLGAELQAE